MSNSLRINCLVSGESTEQIFIVKIESTKTISDLKKSIEEKVWAFRNRYIELLQVDVPHDEYKPVYAETATKLTDPLILLSNVFNDPLDNQNIHIIARCPQDEVIEDLRDHYSALFKCLQVNVSKLQRWAHRDIQKNLQGGIFVEDREDHPLSVDILQDIEHSLNRNRVYSKGQFRNHMHFKIARTHHYFDGIYKQLPPAPAPPVVETVREFTAFNRIHEDFLPDVDRIKQAKSSALKASQFFQHFISPAFFSSPNSNEHFEYTQDMPWQFPIFINSPGMESPCQFLPKNDAMVVSPLFQCPLLISEVASQEDGSDRWRMLLEAIAVARAGQFLMKKNEKYFVIAIYLTAEMIAQRFVVAQTGEDSKVSIVQKDFDLTNPNEAVKFHREMFNLATALKGFANKLDKNKKSRLHDLHLAASGVISLTAQAGQKRKRSSWSRDGGGGDSGDGDEPEEEEIGGLQDDLGIFSADDIQAILKAMKYRIDGILFGHPLIAVVSSVIHDSKIRYLKFVREGRKEIEILQYLLAIDSPSNHTIAGVRTWSVRGGNIILMPVAGRWLTSLTNPSVRLRSVAKQLFEAVDFMHQHGVAHMDLKPQNILIPAEGGRLSIIDFSISLRVKGVDDVSCGVIGTAGHIPPEVAAGHGFYSAIRADLWSCGKTLQELCELCRPSNSRDALLKIAQQLMNEDPQKRPTMSDVLTRLTYVK